MENQDNMEFMQEQPADKPKKKKTGLWITLAVVGVILALLLTGIAVGWDWINDKLSLIERVQDTDTTISQEQIDAYYADNTEPMDPEFTGPVLNPEDISWDVDPMEPVVKGPNVINILLVGVDTYSGYGRSDSIILCSLNRSKKTLTMTSIMRDLYVQIPGYMDNRINASYAFGGLPLLKETVETNFGVQIDGCFAVDFSTFTKAIDMVGGVDINLSQAEADYMNNILRFSGGFIAGMNRLDGASALVYARNRRVGFYDFQRTERQRTVLSALLDKCKGLSLGQMNDMMDEILPLLKTDMNNAKIMSYALQALPAVPKLKLTVSQRLPADGTYTAAYVRGMSVLIPNLKENRRILAETIMDDSE